MSSPWIRTRIDLLIALRAKGAASAEEVEVALGTLQRDVWLHGILTILDDRRLDSFGPISEPGGEMSSLATLAPRGPEWSDAEAWTRGFEARCAPSDSKAIKAACREVRRHLKTLRAIRDDLASLITALETP